MVLLVQATSIAILFACLYSIFICCRILVRNDLSFIKDETGSPLRNRRASKYKFAALYGIAGLCGAATLFYGLTIRLPFQNWSYVFCGFLAIFSGTKFFLIRHHKKATKDTL